MVSAAVQGPILIVEDDEKTASLVELYLRREGFQTVVAHDGQRALELVQRHNPIFIILDLMLPVLDGWEVCRELRRSSDVPILILTARGEEVDLISGLNLGADDYLVKPFSPGELVARVKAVLRRASLTVYERVLKAGDLVLNEDTHQVTVHEQPLDLTPSEYGIIKVMMARPGRVFSRTQLVRRGGGQHQRTQ